MLNASRPTQRLSHAFFDCLCNDSTGALSTAATATATAATAAHNGTATSASDSQVHENGERDLFALIVVNGEVGEFLAPLWRHVRICADGGVNRVYAALPPALRSTVLPHCIVGDLDSATPSVLDYYRSLGVEVVKEADQDSTDLHKAIRQLARLDSGVRHAVVYGAFGGRFDQLIGNLVALHSHRRHLAADMQLILLSEGNLAQLIPAGQHLIAGHPAFEGEGKHCGLMALAGEVTGVWTSGLTWDLCGQSLGWDAIQSTSNIIRSTDAQVAVRSERGQLVWTTEFSPSTHSPADASLLHTDEG